MPDLVSDDERLKRIQALTQIQMPNAPAASPVPTAPNIPSTPTAMQPPLRPIGGAPQATPQKPPPMVGSSEDYGNQIQAMRDKQNDPWGSPDNHPGALGKLGHVLGRVGNIAGDIVAPATMSLIPGTDLNNNIKEHALENKQAGAQKAESEQALQSAQTEEAKGRTALTDAQAQALPGKEQSEESLQGAQANEANARAFLAQHPEAKTPQEGYAAAIQDVLKKGGDPLTDPTVKQWQNAIQSVQKAPATTSEQDTERAEKIRQATNMGQPVSPEDAAWLKGHTTEKTLGPAATANFNAPDKANARADRSYQVTSGQLDRLQTPIDQTVQRLGRLQDTLNQNTPQADALVAPELLSVMAGGSGSGLRMNEAEISRIVGGRSKWQSLEASINQWKLDPASARSITPEQQQQIRSLIQTVHDKLTAKQKILDDARQELIDSDDPKDHRRILAETHQKLTSVDNGEAQGGGSGPKAGDVENGFKFKGGDPTKKENWEAVKQ